MGAVAGDSITSSRGVVLLAAANLAIGLSRLLDTLLRTLPAIDSAGIRAFVVHAKDDEARAFYERCDFAPSPTNAFHLFILRKDVRASLGG